MVNYFMQHGDDELAQDWAELEYNHEKEEN